MTNIMSSAPFAQAQAPPVKAFLRSNSRNYCWGSSEGDSQRWPKSQLISRRNALLASAAVSAADGERSPAAAVSPKEVAIPTPPRAPKRPHTHADRHGRREDPFHWLRDDARRDPEVLRYLRDENEFTRASMAATQPLQDALYREMRARIQEDDATVPLRKGRYWYYERTREGQQYVVHCRRRAVAGEEGAQQQQQQEAEGGAATIGDEMDASAAPEEVLLDENAEAERGGHEYFQVGSFEVSPDGQLLAYGEDTDGGEHFSLLVKDLATGQLVGTPVANTSRDIAWANDSRTLFYIKKDKAERPFQVWRHAVGSEQSSDVLVLHEEDESFYLALHRSESGGMLVVLAHSTVTSDVRCLRADEPLGEWRAVTPRVQGVDTAATHRGGHWLIVQRSDEAFNSQLLVAPVDNPSQLSVLLPHRPDVKLEGVQAFEGHLAVFERRNGLTSITVYQLPQLGEPITSLGEGHRIEFDEEAYTLEGAESPYASHVLRFGFTSLKTPYSVYDHDMRTGERTLKKMQPVLGGFSPDDYETARRWATAPDGARVPISIVYRKGRARLDGSDALLMEGYGAYEFCNDPSFSSARLALLDRGVSFAVAHVRGGGEMGRLWYESGKLHHKRNSFTDFIACAEFLIADNQLGGSEAAAEPGAESWWCECKPLRLPFSLPLPEWGNPAQEDDYRYIRSYSPIDNVEAREYPHLLVTAGLFDPRVSYWEPAKYVARLRDLLEHHSEEGDAAASQAAAGGGGGGDGAAGGSGGATLGGGGARGRMLLLKTDMAAGHFSKSGRFDRLKDVAFEYAFWLKSLGMLD
eukprot:jgi/Mesen1/10264/ME000778S09606